MPITVVMKNAAGLPIGPFAPKPTSREGEVLEASKDLWADVAHGTIETGIWEASVGRFGARRDGFHEICYLITGRATLVEEGGASIELEAGDLFVTPAGWVGDWHVHEPVRKVFVIAVTS